MKIIEKINQSNKTLFSFELLPPLKGQDASRLYHTIEELLEFNPQYINLTTHRDEIEYKEIKTGVFEKKTVRKRPGTVAIAAAIQHKYGVPVVPHVLCAGYSKEETENMLLDLHFLGIKNILALRGDSLRTENLFKPQEDGHKYAVDLVHQISDISTGKYIDPDIKNKTCLDFCVGVAGYPEKHFEAPNLNFDLDNVKRKVDAGADYIVTQMFFDNQKYFDFVDKCRAIGITVPIIPGIKPLSKKVHFSLIPRIFSLDLPEPLAKELQRCKTNDDALRVGTEWAILQAKELVKNNVPSLHLYTYGLADNTKEILKSIF
ncbi:methylenetetrahydrofolate reductase [NAD(P)H] [Halosquirtibacter laminarini]|uniref:Methylenetetrahydrofolate reductase [NAD(P)H] n=1 Tax=Halosquirtibacter laminarini TaxID=3374600 RepID=A0AC61NKK0_9BACT|nr:methylenetetrahydrofolate reductase [NAD(P)H] [Prolixibacteraceae bacterium]